MIENGRVVDGTGSAWFYGDIAVKDGRIARIVPKGVLRGTSASERIDAYGHVVSPGFSDIQSQSRYAFLDGDSRVVSKVTQGVLITDCISSETASLRRALSRCGRGATLRNCNYFEGTACTEFEAWRVARPAEPCSRHRTLLTVRDAPHGEHGSTLDQGRPFGPPR